MAIKVQGTTVIDDSKNILNIGIATVGILSANKITTDGSTNESGVGVSNYVLTSGGTGGDISWQSITSAGGGTLDGITVQEENSTVGTAGSITTLKFVGNNITATAVAGGAIATITASDTPTFDTLGIGTRIDLIPYDTLDNGTLSFEGSAGQLFSITNNLSSGSIFSVNDVSGIPSIDVDADGTIQLAPYSSTEYVGIGTTNPTAKLDVNGTVNVFGNATFQSNVYLGDSDVLNFGAGNDLQIYHDGTNNYIDGHTGDLWIRSISPGDDVNIRSNDDLTIQTAAGTNAAVFIGGGGARLYHNGSIKFETTGIGVSIVGTGTTATITGPSNLVLDPGTVGDNTGTVIIKGDLQVDGTQTIINSTTLEVDDKLVSIAKSATTAIQADGAGLEINGASATLTYRNSDDKWVFNKSVAISGELDATALNPTGAISLQAVNNSTSYGSTTDNPPQRIVQSLGGSDYWQIYGESSQTNYGSLVIEVNDDRDDSETIIFRNRKNYTPGGADVITFMEMMATKLIIPEKPLAIGATTLTGTSSQPLQVTGGAYVSGNLGVGVTNPGAKLVLPITNTYGADTFHLGTANSWASSAEEIYTIGFGDPITTQTGIGMYGSNRSIWNRYGLSVHVKSDSEFSIKSTGWDNLFGVQGGGNVYIKNKLGINTTAPGSTLAVGGTITELYNGSYWNVVTQADVGYGASQVPLNQYLGQLAFLDDHHPNGLRRDGGGSDDVVVSAGGTVGIGTDTVGVTGYALEVRGNVFFHNGGQGSNLLNMSNGGIYNANSLTFADPGPNEGVIWGGGNGWSIYESPNDLTTNSAGNLQFVDSGVRILTLDTSGNAEFTGNVGVGTTNPTYKLHVIGSFAATTKSFVIDHPTKEGMKLRYGSLEGPENGVYVRGRLKGNNTIELPEHWTGLVDDETITINLTPIGRKAPLHSVVDIADNTVVVESANDVVDCFYTVFGERKDVEKLEVEF